MSQKTVNLCSHLIKASEQIPNQLAVSIQKKNGNSFSYQELTFKQLHIQSDAIAYALNQYGINRGDKAVLMVTPSIAFFTLTFALFKAGIIPILVDPGMGIKNLKKCFQEAQPDAFIGIPKAHLARCLFAWGKDTVTKLVTANSPALFGGISLSKLLKKYPLKTNYKMHTLEADELAAILFTSGSTGTPKGVVYSHRMFEAQISVLKEDYQIKPGEADLATFPLFSLFGPALGMASIVPDMDASKPITADPKHLFAAVEQYQCTNLFANPALLEVLGQAGKQQHHKMPSIKRVISAGAPATISSIELFSEMLNKQVPVINSYGATESLPVSKINSQDLLKTTNITDQGGGICVGKAVDNAQVQVIKISEKSISEWQDSLALPPYQIGEIVVKAPQASKRYYQRSQATTQSKIHDGKETWHRMGDLGYLDDQNKLWMCGRKAHRVDSTHLSDPKTYYSIPCERIFNTHSVIKRSALVAVKNQNKVLPALCIEINNNNFDKEQLFTELCELGARYNQTSGITLFFIHKKFPMDIRHNAKIFREQLAVWAQKRLKRMK